MVIRNLSLPQFVSVHLFFSTSPRSLLCLIPGLDFGEPMLVMEKIPTPPGLYLVGNTYDVDFVDQTASLEALAKTYGRWTALRSPPCETVQLDTDCL